MAPGGQLLAPDGEEQAAQDTRTPAERLQALLADCRNRAQALTLIRISLDEILRLAQERFPELEGFRLYEFLVGSCRRLLRGIGQVEIPRPRVLVLLVHGMKDADRRCYCGSWKRPAGRDPRLVEAAASTCGRRS
jgi:hypothetical protein